MPQIKKHLRNLYRTNPDEKTREGYLCLDMNEGVPGLPAGFVRKALKEINPEHIAKYPEYKKLQNSIARHNKLRPENICLSNGSDAAIKCIFDAYVSAGDKVLLTDPTFAMYNVYCEMFNAERVVVPYNADLSFPIRKFIDKISSGVKIAVIVNPNNPTGAALNAQDLLNVIKIAHRKDVLLVVDEAYFYFYPHSVIKQVNKYDNLIVLRTFSKLLGMASVRIGYAAACPDIIENLRRVKPTYDVNGLAVLLANKVFEDASVIKNLIKQANEGKRYLVNKLCELRIKHNAGCANFVLINCGDRVDEVAKKLKERGILVAHGFKQPFLKNYIRVTVGNKACMRIFWDNFRRVFKNAR